MTEPIESIKCDIPYDTAETCQKKLNQLREAEKFNKMKSIPYRLSLLKKLLSIFDKYESEIHISNNIDLGQSEFFSKYCTFYLVRNEILTAINNLYTWTQPKNCDVPLVFALSNSYVKPEPFGVCLIFGAWNCNFLSVINPLVGAIAAGNLCIVKPASSSPETCKVCMKILNEMPPDAVQCCAGKPEVYTTLLASRFDLIIFTGSAEKGKLIAKAAAENLTPTILELGGQNPVIVEKSANIKNAAYNIVSGRMTMNGQMCIAPEYVMVDKAIHIKLVEEIKKTYTQFYGEANYGNDGLGKMINNRHYKRVMNLIENPGGKCTLLWGDPKKCQEENRFISPIFFGFDNLDDMGKSELAKDEIFGPVLYIAPYDFIEQAINYINVREKPLSCYLFTSDNKVKEYVRDNTSTGCLDINDTILHFAHQDLPFGGVGNSGIAAHHGKWGFFYMSHWKPVVDQSKMIIPMRYPPYNKSKQKMLILSLKYLLRGRNGLVDGLKKVLICIVVLFVVYKMFIKK